MSNQYAEVFEVELRCWCYGLNRVRERVDRSVLHKVIKEFAPVLREAVENLYVCDILEISRELTAAAKCKGQEKEIAFYILSHLPDPLELKSSQADVLYQIVDTVEQAYGGAVARLEKKWKGAKQGSHSKDKSPESQFSRLSLPSR